MEDLGIKLNPLTKLEIYKACKDTVFAQMDGNIITPERADEILGYVKEQVAKIESPEQAKDFYIYIANKFGELKGVEIKFNMEEEEKIDIVISRIIDEFIGEGNIDLAGEIMEQLNKSNNEIIIEKLKTGYPIQFKMALEKLGKN
ncbi:MAG: hypothetical protein HQK60_08925 [Deltaproteobacteria bacterium]|nr:hypothetical protein [Deltaproteobacteria bacterium]